MIAGFALLVVVTLYRLLPVFLGWTTVQPEWFINVSPLAALCLCSAAMLPRRWALALPLTTLIGTDLILNYHYGYPLVNAYFFACVAAFVAILALGWQLRGKATPGVMFVAALGSSLFFYFVTNTASWLQNSAYAGNFAGWAQAMTTGVPGLPPTWMFYRNSLVSDLVFTALFLFCVRRRPATDLDPAIASARW